VTCYIEQPDVEVFSRFYPYNPKLDNSAEIYLFAIENDKFCVLYGVNFVLSMLATNPDSQFPVDSKYFNIIKKDASPEDLWKAYYFLAKKRDRERKKLSLYEQVTRPSFKPRIFRSFASNCISF
jgi:hypothetical protein